MVHAPFSLYKRPRKDGSMWWWARFWDYKRKRFAITRPLDIQATGKHMDALEAYSKAKEMLPTIGIDVTESTFVSWVIQFRTPGGSIYLKQNGACATTLGALSAANTKKP